MKVLKGRYILIFSIFIILFIMLSSNFAYAAAPMDENFDSAGVGDKGTQSYTLNGITYKTNDNGGLNINIVNDGNIASGGDLALGYRSSSLNTTTQVSFITLDGSEFKLNSFVISTGLGDTTVTIKGYRDNSEVASSSVTTASFTTFNVSTNSNWENIDEVRMTGADLDIDIDDIDFSPPVLPTHTVTYNGNTNTSGAVPIDGNIYHITDTVTVLGNTGSLVKTGYTFTGWNTASNGSGTDYNGGDTFAMGSSNVTLYAQWTENTYTVTYNGNDNTGGSVPVDGTSYYNGDTATVLINTGSLVKTGYTFTGWNTAANGSGTSYTGGDTFSIGTSNITLYAQYNANQYIVTFESNGGSGIDSITVDYDSLITAPIAPTKTGYDFVGWYKEAVLTTAWDFSTDTIPASEITLYGKWTIKEYTVTFEDHDGTILKTETVEHGSGATAPAEPTREGHTFSGWAVDYSNVIEDLTVTAQYNANQYIVTFESNGGSGIDSITVDYDSLITAPIAPTKTGYDFVGWYKEAVLTTAWDFSTDTIPASDITLYGKWNRISSGGSSGGSSSNSNSESSDDEAGSNEQEENTIVIVNGQEEKAGIESVTEESGEKVVEVKVDSEVINEKIEEVIRRQGQNEGETQPENIIEVPTLAQGAKKMTTVLTGDIVKKMDENNFKLSIVSDVINYVIPAKEVGIENIAKNLGLDANQLKEIEVEIRINKVDEKITREIQDKAKSNGQEIVFPPMSFEVVAKTKTASGEEKQLTVSKFNQYVQRVMKLPEGVDPSKITTGIVYNEDGTFSHVPTRVFMKDGIYYAKINSLTNSSYSAIWNPVIVKSVENHWSKNAVNDMAARLVIKNPEMFIPNQEITRGEFAEYITKALGIFRTGAIKTQKFSDVEESHELADAIQIAAEYGIISGYPDGSFKPSARISREEAMVMYSRAMDISGLQEVNNDRILSYIDKDLVAGWAYNDVKKTVSAGVFNGKTKETINPKDTFTCAEASAAIRNLLVASGLIND